jgi:phosphate/sulfate permease
MLFGLIPQEEALFELLKKAAHNMIGLPVSTTQTITMSVMRVGAIKRLSAVRWGVTKKILYAWIFTLPGGIHLLSDRDQV